MLIRREQPADHDAVREVVRAAFADQAAPGTEPVEVGLLDALRADRGWIPELSMVAVEDGNVVGHVVCTRAHIGADQALGLGPLAALPDRQRQGIGSALMHAVLGAADALGEPVVVLLGHLDYYPRFGFRPATEFGITPPVAEWGEHFQARPLTAYRSEIRGAFEYAKPFNDL
ncbi:N-acetyltransferase [Saccharopolyspora taberi]|uniref:GNAT family N-acetyltransferase n=1 Tax=Saccharopolyspora taberi TaxID=60895 RepID=UPI0031DB5179